MGKDLKGKELGRNISQEKTGFYCGRFTDKNGKRIVKRFKKLQECRQWVAESMFADEHSDFSNPTEMTVDAWYEEWLALKKQEVRSSTCERYEKMYQQHIQPLIGKMLLKDVKPMHCQKILNKMADDGMKSSTISNNKIVLSNLLETAFRNDVIKFNPCHKLSKTPVGKSSEPRECLTRDVQRKFIECIKYHRYRRQFSFVLQTGLRVGELIGLHWEDIDFKKKRLKVQRSMGFSQKLKQWVVQDTKTDAGTRTIPLTNEAISILLEQKKCNGALKVIPLEWKENVFLNYDGLPIRTDYYNASLYAICDKQGFSRFSMHILRHTFATRCIEGGMKPKTLQKILGHSKIEMTMNTYVHTTEDEKEREIKLVESALMAH